MKILLVTNHLNTGGISSYLMTLSAGLVKRGHTVYLASSGGSLLPRFIGQGVDCLDIPLKTKNEFSPRVAVSAVRLAAGLSRRAPDLIHAQTRTSQVLGCLVARWSRIPCMSTCHGFFNQRRWARRTFPCWGRHVIAVSDSVRVHLRDDFGVPENRISVIHNGIDVESLQQQKSSVRKDEVRAQLGVGEGFLIGTLGRLSDIKGHRYLIEAMPRVLETAPGTRLVIIGAGKMEHSLRSLIGSLCLEEQISIIDGVKNIGGALAALDVFVMPSLQEGLGLALMEAMACGCAVVGSAVGGITSLIRDRQTGLLVRPQDPLDIAQAVVQLLRDEPLRRRLGEAAERFITEHFSQAGMVEQTERVYKQCLG